MVGLSDQVLKRQVFQSYASFSDVDALRATCCTYEAAWQDARSWRENPRTAGTDVVHGDDADVAAAKQSNSTSPNHPTCRNSGGRHTPDRAHCPARFMTCHGCQKVGHMKKCCRSSKKLDKGQAASLDVLGAVVVAGAHHMPQPVIGVTITRECGSTLAHVTAVADTGAQVCVAGPSLMSAINLKPALLQRRAGLLDVADLPLKCMGSAPCRISCGGKSTVHAVYFVKTAKQFYLSLSACKDFGLVPDDFPLGRSVEGQVPPSTGGHMSTS